MWEVGLQQGAIGRALRLLGAVYPEQSAEALAKLSIGERDWRLFQTRRLLFGPSMICTAHCPRCSEPLEWESSIDELCVHAEVAPPMELTVEAENYRLRYRLPNSRDLAAVFQDANEASDRRRHLLTRCLIEATGANGEALDIEQLSDSAMEAMAREMDRADPQANLQIQLTCPACGNGWEGPFDVVSFLWAEVHNWALRTLRTVHLLARAYGWREADVLAMSQARRQIYLEMASQ